MQPVLFTCSEFAALDAGTNRISVFHILEEINAVSFPAFHGNMAVIAFLTREGSEPSTSTLQLVAELNGQPIFGIPFPVDYQNHLKVRSINQIQGVPIPAPGILRVRLVDGARDLAEWKIQVSLVGQPQMVQQAPPEAPSPEAARPSRSTRARARSRRGPSMES